MRFVIGLIAFSLAFVLLGAFGTSAASMKQLVGGGLIVTPVSGKTINSPSDFGFAVNSDGGTFLCSMAGPLTGGFKGLKVMTVEGPVDKGSLKVTGNTATFTGKATIVLVPGMNGEPVSVLNGVAYTATVGLGGAEKAWLVLNVPAFTKTLGGNTGGMVKVGSITWR